MYDAKYFMIILFFIVIKWYQNIHHFDTLTIYYALNSYFFLLYFSKTNFKLFSEFYKLLCNFLK